MKKSIIYTFIFLLWVTVCPAQNPTNPILQKITGWQTISGLANASICISVSDNQTNERLIESKPQLSLVPASILKTITTATALEVLAPTSDSKPRSPTPERYVTILCFGDLQIIGGGDPTLGLSIFPGDQTISGRVDKSLEEQEYKSHYWDTHYGCNNLRAADDSRYRDMGRYWQLFWRRGFRDQRIRQHV